MKIGMLVNNLEVSGGYQKLVIRLSQNLKKLGHSVVIFTPKLNAEKCYPNDIKDLAIVTISKRFADVTPVESYAELSKKIDSSFDSFIIHDELSLIGIGIMAEPPKTVVWMLNNQLPENLGKYMPEVKSVYKQTIGSLSTKIKEIHKAIDRVMLMRKGLRRTSKLVTYDEFNKQLVKKMLGRDAQNIYAGADLEQFKEFAKQRDFKKKPSYTVLSVGVVFPHRRYEDLIRAAALLVKAGVTNTKITIVGRQDLSPDYFAELEDLARQLHVERHVRFINYVTDQEMIRLYRDSDIFAFINDGFTWGISVFEAVAAKLPVIITDNIGAVDLIKDRVHGRLVKPKSPEDVAAAISDIILDRSNAQAYATAAYQDILKIVSWEAYTQRILQAMSGK